MDYQKIYDNLMKKRLENPPTGKFERHHIVPKSLGGPDTKDNLVKLTLREHYIAHLLLCRIHRGTRNYYSMVRAFHMMKAGRDGDFIKNSRMFEYFREDLGRAMSEAQSGEGNSQYGTVWYHNPEHKLSQRFKVGEEIPAGWVKGRKIKGYTNFNPNKSSKRPRMRRERSGVRSCEICKSIFHCNPSSGAELCISCRTERKRTKKPKIDYAGAYDEWIKSDLAVHEFAKLKNVPRTSIVIQWRKLKLDFESENKSRKLRNKPQTQ